MEGKEKIEGMLSPYRVLDLTDEKGLLCGRILGDLGADVIKIEPPGGDPTRSIGPFYHDEAEPEKSLFWFAYNTSKRGITLDIEAAGGQEIFKKLVKTADFVVESFPPGYMDKLGLGYPALEKVNPGIIMVSITPFGQTGPYKDYKISDIVAWAMGGIMYMTGDQDSPPVRISHHSQAYLHAGGKAAVGAMLALYHREMTGEGQHVDVSIQESVVLVTYLLTSAWDMLRVQRERGKLTTSLGIELKITQFWTCKDGDLVFWRYWSGPPAKARNTPLVEWMDSEGAADDYLKNFDWETFDFRAATQEVIDRLTEPTARFFRTHTKAEIYEEALKRRIMIYPVVNTTDILTSPQLAAREFWTELEHPELGTTLTYPGAFAKVSQAPPRVSRRAPLIGEHNEDIYEKELGLSREELLLLKQTRVI